MFLSNEEMEESSADVIGYGMSVVAKDTGPWCSLRRRSTSRRQTSASPRPADCEMPVLCPSRVWWLQAGGTERRHHGDDVNMVKLVRQTDESASEVPLSHGVQPDPGLPHVRAGVNAHRCAHVAICDLWLKV